MTPALNAYIATIEGLVGTANQPIRRLHLLTKKHNQEPIVCKLQNYHFYNHLEGRLQFHPKTDQLLDFPDKTMNTFKQAVNR
jgi:hypothetical protein